MSGKPNKKDNLEVSSDQLRAELIEIKERVGALETIASIANRSTVEAYVRTSLKTDQGRLIMKECEQPRTKEYLVSKLKLKTSQALDHHLRPLREDDLLRQRFEDEGRKIVFEWSNLFRRLPKSTLKKILEDSK